MKKTIEALNQLEANGLFDRYAIGGAIAALYYMDPFETEDLDIFIMLTDNINPLAPISGIYDECRRLGYVEDGPYMVIEGLPVQFLPAYNSLIEEAVTEAVEVTYNDAPTRVPTAEHLGAIMLQTGRPKDRIRFEALREQATVDPAKLSDIVARHNLTERYNAWTH